MMMLTQEFIVFQSVGGKTNDTNQVASPPLPNWDSRLGLEQLQGETCCWASPSQEWSPEERDAEKPEESKRGGNRHQI